MHFKDQWFIIMEKAVKFMKEEIRKYFLSKNIEYFAVLSYSDCVETNSKIMEREKFSPKSVIVYLLPYYTEVGRAHV